MQNRLITNMRVKHKNTTYKSSKFRDFLVRILTYSNKNIVIYSGNLRLREAKNKKKKSHPNTFYVMKNIANKGKIIFHHLGLCSANRKFYIQSYKSKTRFVFFATRKASLWIKFCVLKHYTQAVLYCSNA